VQRGFPLELGDTGWAQETRMMECLAEKKSLMIYLAVLTHNTRVTDRHADKQTNGQTPDDGYTAFMHSVAR